MSEHDKKVIERYIEEEHMMILLFAQWCINHRIDPHELYHKAYPDQPNNKLLDDMIQHTVPRAESDEISKQLVVAALQAFGNDNLAFEVEQYKINDQPD